MCARALNIVSAPERKAEVKVTCSPLSCDNFNVHKTNKVKVMDY